MYRTITILISAIILSSTAVNAMSAGERMYLKKTRQAAPVTRYVHKTTEPVETVTERPSSANYKAGHKYFGSLQLMQRDRMVKMRQDQLAKAEGGQERIEYCQNKYWDSLRYAACVGEPTR